MPPSLSLLDTLITDLELAQAIKETSTGKASGPDGFTLSYYKQFLSLLAPRFLKAFNSLSQPSSICPTTLSAYVTVIPKEGKHPTQCSSYRPISLLNVDIKLFAKIIALRLIPHLQKLIHLDQVGSMPIREARDRTICAINIIHSALSKNYQSFILATDAEKDFDRVDWTFICLTIETIGVGPHMRSWLETLYSNPSAQI